MQSKKTILNITMAFILTTSVSAFAQGPGGGHGGRGQQPPKPAVDTALDVNGDEVITADEIAGAASALVALPTRVAPLRPPAAPPPAPGASADATQAVSQPVALVGLDTDHDGSLSFDECMGLSSGGGQQAPTSGRGGSGGQPPAPPIFSALDTSGDEIVDEYEIADAPSSLLELDDNGDGQLQADETRPEHPGGRRGGQNQRR